MRRKLIFITMLAAMAASVVTTARADQAVKREQRGIWMTAYLSDWPSTAITASNANTLRNACCKMLDTLRVNHINAIYYHARVMCDALYKSSYEPWSSYVSGTRGAEPAFDPLDFIVQEAHKRGIELYAWVNPYRYASGTNMWGQSDSDYVYTHPDWLMTTSYETVLNPGIPAVRQRVVDVCRDIITRYDVDGLVFDDYFYNQDNPSFSLDSAQYADYKAAGGTMTQGDWRRENVNQMVHEVNQMVKATKPWVRFGIGPAGVACSATDVAEKYGVEPCPGSDWQYNQIYSDPMAWLTRGTIDFMSPQIYWNTTGNYEPVTRWWGKMGARFNRHVYVSQWIPDGEAWTLAEYVKQARIMRDAMTAGNPGMVYFRYATWRNKSEKIDGKVRQLRIWLRDSIFNTVALNPAPAWLKPDRTYTTVTSLQYADGTLSWDSIANVRYVVYAIPDDVPDADFNAQPQYIDGVSYWASYTLPADKQQGYRYAVSILDRWENEYAPLMVGATATQATAPVLRYPADGDTVPQLTLMQWGGDTHNYTVEVYADAAMDSLVAQMAVDSLACPLPRVPGVTTGSTYWWRVVARDVNRWDNASPLWRFTVSDMRIITPADGETGVTLTPTLTWTQAAAGTTYLLELATNAGMTAPDSVTTTAPQWTAPRYRLAGAVTYYARVTATLGGVSVTTPVTAFTTVEAVPPVPQFITPAASGITLYSDDVVSFEPVEGAASLRVTISSSTSFPARTSYNGTLDGGDFQTPLLGDIRGTGRLTDGKTYYARARYAYYTLATGTTLQYTDYCDTRQFIYRETLRGDVNGDGEVTIADVNAIVDLILSGGYAADADVNSDGEVSIADVNAVIDRILDT